MEKDIVIIGGGPAGMAAALAAKENGAEDILIIERSDRLGGILNQCIHNGFGIEKFKKELTGPEYADIYEKRIKAEKIKYLTNAMVTGVLADKTVTVCSEEGVKEIKAKAIVFATGCRERTRGSLNIPGFRGAGVINAGTAQKFINEMGYVPGKKVVILGSGDIGLIMARRCTLEGAQVLAVAEIMPQSRGLKRNIVQCLNDFDIPLYLSHTVTKIYGKSRVTGVDIAKVDENLNPISETTFHLDCDTLMLSVGLIPENELARMAGIKMDEKTGGPVVDENLETSLPGVYSCGNCLHVFDIVDNVSDNAEIAGKSAAEFVKKECGK